VFILMPHGFRIHFNIILTPTPMSTKCFLPFRLHYWTLYCCCKNSLLGPRIREDLMVGGTCGGEWRSGYKSCSLQTARVAPELTKAENQCYTICVILQNKIQRTVILLHVQVS
jgi:hypothetical protein